MFHAISIAATFHLHDAINCSDEYRMQCAMDIAECKRTFKLLSCLKNLNLIKKNSIYLKLMKIQILSEKYCAFPHSKQQVLLYGSNARRL